MSLVDTLRRAFPALKIQRLTPTHWRFTGPVDRLEHLRATLASSPRADESEIGDIAQTSDTSTFEVRLYPETDQ